MSTFVEAWGREGRGLGFIYRSISGRPDQGSRLQSIDQREGKNKLQSFTALTLAGAGHDCDSSWVEGTETSLSPSSGSRRKWSGHMTHLPVTQSRESKNNIDNTNDLSHHDLSLIVVM